ncbi:PRKAA1, partial [Symbiodinium sp. KB8]
RLHVLHIGIGYSQANVMPMKTVAPVHYSPAQSARAAAQGAASTSLPQRSPHVVSNKNLGHYILGRTIGEGTFGKVKLGRHILTGERVAVKVLEKDRIQEVADIERVAREVQLLKLIRHPHVVQLFEIIETRGQLYLIMEYASGGELFDYIVQNQRVPEPEACRFFHQIIAGVEQIHAMNVVHRDLKPENLLLDEHKCIKIVDFGLSNRFDDNQLLRTACGSPCYAPPEMVSGQSYVPQMCDLWSCGVILFAMVCGFLPFEDSNTSALYKKILAANYTAPSFITDSVKELIAGLLTVDPAKRFTIADVRAHEWYRQLPEASVRPRDLVSRQCGLEEDVLQELKCHGFPQEYATNCLLNNKHNSVTTTYYLLAAKRRRMAEHLQLRESERAREDRARSPVPSPGASAMDERPAAEPLRENSTGADGKVHVLGSGSGTTQKDNEKADARAEAAAILREATPEPRPEHNTAVSPPSSTRAGVTRPGSARTGASPQDISRDSQVSTPTAISGRAAVTRPNSLRATQASGSDVTRDTQVSPPTSGRIGVTRPTSARAGASPQDVVARHTPTSARVTVPNSPTPSIASSSGGVSADIRMDIQAHYVLRMAQTPASVARSSTVPSRPVIQGTPQTAPSTPRQPSSRGVPEVSKVGHRMVASPNPSHRVTLSNSARAARVPEVRPDQQATSQARYVVRPMVVGGRVAGSSPVQVSRRVVTGHGAQATPSTPRQPTSRGVVAPTARMAYPTAWAYGRVR